MGQQAQRDYGIIPAQGQAATPCRSRDLQPGLLDDKTHVLPHCTVGFKYSRACYEAKDI